MSALVVVESGRSTRELYLDQLGEDLASERLRLEILDVGYRNWDPLEVLGAMEVQDPESMVVVLRGLEATPPGRLASEKPGRPPTFARLNQLREAIELQFPMPLIVWTTPAGSAALQRYAPDFFDHYAGIVRFPQLDEAPAAPSVSLERGPIEASVDRPDKPGAAVAIRFYEEQLERVEPGSSDHRRALLGFAQALLELPEHEVPDRLEDAVALARKVLDLQPDPEEEARAQAVLGLGLRHLGRLREALAATERAVGIRRHLSSSRPNTFLPHLAGSLDNLGNVLSDLGWREEALAATEQAVEIWRRLSSKRPEAFLPDHARSLTNLGTHLSKLGRREEALSAAEEAVGIQRRLASSALDALLPDLGKSLSSLGLRLSELGRREEALAAAEEAVGIYRNLSSSRPDAFLPDLGMSLNNLGVALGGLGWLEEALAATREAGEIFRRLSPSRPDAFLPKLVRNSGLRSSILRGLDRYDEAAASAVQGLTNLLQLHEHPQALRGLAAALLRDYLSACEEGEIEPDADLLSRTDAALTNDATP
jgi:tetratricopeptide (TPR) repeat protein